MTSLTALTIAEARRGLRERRFSALELTDAYLAAIERARILNAYIVETPEKARGMAAASDAKLASGDAGPLEGMPLGIKDLFATKGIHTQACSHVLDGFKPTYESTITANLWRDGAVMLGKLNMDEFAMGSSNETSYYGNVINPWRRERSNAALVPGGSSGGSASAVAAHICAAATATDTGGSIRQPAAFTPSPALWASSRPMAAARAGASSPSHHRSTRLDPSPAMSAMPRSCSVPWRVSIPRTRPPLMCRCPITKRRSAGRSKG
jgi:aspartyl-tRNA(Asn)/glutamyl-tRNA(Gln) amidotransferase subunit A